MNFLKKLISPVLFYFEIFIESENKAKPLHTWLQRQQ